MNYNSDNIILDAKKHHDSANGNQDIPRINDEDIFFAKERYNLHQSSSEEGVDTDILKKYFSKKYGF